MPKLVERNGIWYLGKYDPATGKFEAGIGYSDYKTARQELIATKKEIQK